MTEPKEMVRNSLFTITDLTLQFSSEVFFFSWKRKKKKERHLALEITWNTLTELSTQTKACHLVNTCELNAVLQVVRRIETSVWGLCWRFREKAKDRAATVMVRSPQWRRTKICCAHTAKVWRSLKPTR